MLQFYNSAASDMSQTESKLLSIGKILGGAIFCLLVSLGIYSVSIVFIYGAWHCPDGNCQTPLWVNVTVFLLLTSPLLVFVIGACLARGAIYALTQNTFLRILLFLIFACLPLLLFAGFVFYAVNSTN